MSKVGSEIECIEELCFNRFVKQSPRHIYCESCSRKRRIKHNRLYYEIKGKEKRKQRSISSVTSSESMQTSPQQLQRDTCGDNAAHARN